MIKTVFVALILWIVVCEGGDPCCSQPCQNRGVCTSIGKSSYECDCIRTGYYGENCTSPELFTWIKTTLKPAPNTVHYILTHFKGFWNILNNIPFLRDTVMRYVLTSRSHLIESPPIYNSDYGYKSWEAYSNLSYYTRTLPPVPMDCPTPMGVAGKKALPDAKMIVQKFLMRKRFIPDPQGSNLMFAFFAQHFTHQFFRTDLKKGPAFTRGLGHGVDLGHIYGENLEKQNKLRLFKDGKLKYQVMNGEVYPPLVRDVQVDMHYPPHILEEHRFAVGHEAFGLIPGLMMYATIWLREHNRVCDVLKQEHADWDDERLFQTTRLILIGEQAMVKSPLHMHYGSFQDVVFPSLRQLLHNDSCQDPYTSSIVPQLIRGNGSSYTLLSAGETIKIVIEEYVQHLSGYNFKLKFDPALLFNQRFQYQNRIASEFNTLYHWHPLMPDAFHIQDQVYNYQQFLFNNSLLIEHGIHNLVDSFTKQIAGRVAGGQNLHPAVMMVATKSIEDSRKMRYQSLNAYRKRFSMRPYQSFEEMTGEKNMASELQDLYGDIDAMELYPGLMVEKPRPNSIFGETMVEMGAPYSLKGLMGNPICSPEYWKPSTFGGNVGFEIVNTASLQKLVCRNVKGSCPVASFHVPDVKDTGSAIINSSAAHSRQSDLNPAVILQKRTSEL